MPKNIINFYKCVKSLSDAYSIHFLLLTLIKVFNVVQFLKYSFDFVSEVYVISGLAVYPKHAQSNN